MSLDKAQFIQSYSFIIQFEQRELQLKQSGSNVLIGQSQLGGFTLKPEQDKQSSALIHILHLGLHT